MWLCEWLQARQGSVNKYRTKKPFLLVPSNPVLSAAQVRFVFQSPPAFCLVLLLLQKVKFKQLCCSVTLLFLFSSVFKVIFFFFLISRLWLLRVKRQSKYEWQISISDSARWVYEAVEGKTLEWMLSLKPDFVDGSRLLRSSLVSRDLGSAQP